MKKYFEYVIIGIISIGLAFGIFNFYNKLPANPPSSTPIINLNLHPF